MDLTCLREDTVHTLVEIVDRERVAHVKGPPASGKSYLAYLLLKYYRERNVPRVILKTWPEQGAKPNSDYYSCTCAADERYTIKPWALQDADIVFILDDAHMSYSDENLWLGIIKFQSGRSSGPRICLFSSYGSPTSGPESTLMNGPAVFFNVKQRISITPSNIEGSPTIALFYTQKEFADVVERFCKAPQYVLRLNACTCDFIYRLTNGHPGAVESMLKVLDFVYHSDLEHNIIEALESKHVFETLDDETMTFEHLSLGEVQRSFVDWRKITPESTDTLREVLVKGAIPLDLNRPGVWLCYREGWLHSEPLDHEALNIALVFPTRLHAKYVKFLLNDTVLPFSKARDPDI